MAKFQVKAGSLSYDVALFGQDSSATTGAGLGGLSYNSTGLTAYYKRQNASASVLMSLASKVIGQWTSAGFILVDNTNMPGVVELGIPNAALATGAKWVLIELKGASNLAPIVFEIELTATDNQDATRFGMTALPNANAEAAGGLYTRGTGAGQINQTVNGLINANLYDIVDAAVSTSLAQLGVNVVNINAVSASSVTTVNANQGTTQPVNFTGTGASALAKADMVDIAGAAVNTASAQVGANVVSYASGQAPLQPTVSGRTLDVTATGEAGVDWANIGAPTTTVDLSGTTIKNVDNAIANVTTVATTTSVTNRVTANTDQWAGGTIPSPNVTGVPIIDLKYILGTVLTETSGQIAAAFKQFFNIASPTSTMNVITAVTTTTTATTATNLTNAPTSGDFTATMKTSLNNATPSVTVSDKTGFSLSAAGVQAIWDALTSALTTVGSIGKLLVTDIDAAISSRSTYAGGAVSSVTGNVGGNVVGSVASVTAGVTVTTNNDKTGYTASTVSDKTGYSLSATGLDSITATRPSGIASTFPQMLVLLYYRFFGKSTLTSTQLKTYAGDGSTVVTTQTVSDDTVTQTQGEAS